MGAKNSYTKLLHKLPSGMCFRGGQFYFRRRVPHDIRGQMGRTEIWRSLRTDSLKCAVRRFPLIASQIEAKIEGARLRAGMAVDQMLLGTVGPSAPAGRQMPASPTPMRVSAEQPAISPQAPSLTFGEVYDRNINDPTRGWAVPFSLREGLSRRGRRFRLFIPDRRKNYDDRRDPLER